MAVIDNVEVTISSRFSTLQEFPLPIDDHSGDDDGDHPSCTKIVKCYIGAVPGANFEINYSIKGGQTFRNSIMESQTSEDVDYLSFNTWVDGRRVLAPIVEPERLQHGDWSVFREGSRSGSGSYWVVQPYTWAALLSTDQTPNTTVDDIKARYGKIGSIRVEFSRKQRVRVARRFEPVSLNKGPVPEQAIKGQAVDLGVGLQRARPRHRPVKVHHGEMIDDGPLAIFVFLYRSKNALQILGVLPQTPEPEPAEVEPAEVEPVEERDPATLSLAENLELFLQQQAEFAAMKAKVKKEKAEADMPRLGTTKRKTSDDEEEDNLTVVQVSRKLDRKETKIIDLTDD